MPSLDSADHAGSSNGARISNKPNESTPLISRGNGRLDADNDKEQSKRSFRLTRWPSFVALIVLCITIVIIIVVAFVVPQVVEQYAMQAAVIEPTSLKITEIASWGVLAHITANFGMNASRVHSKPVRDIGRFGTWIAKEVQTGDTLVTVSVPEFGNVEIGSASIPPLKVNVRQGHTTPVDFFTTLKPGSEKVVKKIADAWLGGKLDSLKVHGKAEVPIKSGIFSFGTQSISRNIVIEPHDLPAMPKYNLSHVLFHEIQLPGGSLALTADVGLQIANGYPFDFTIPSMGFSILAPNCEPKDERIRIADATTPSIHVKAYEDIALNVTGVLQGLSDALVRACPKNHSSPLDGLLGNYLHGKPSTLYVRGSDSPGLDVPRWITDIISGISVPVPFPGQNFGKLIRKFSLAKVVFVFPDSEAEPDTPEANPKISAEINALVALPKEMNFPIAVHRIRANADVFFRGRKLGFLDLRDWQDAESKPTKPFGGGQPGLEVRSVIDEAPLRIEDDDVFTALIQALIKERQIVNLTVKALVDVEVKTALGKFVIRKIPGDGIVPVKPFLPRGDLASLMPKIYDLEISETDGKSLTLDLMMDFTNPTEYSATVPYVDVHLLVNDTLLGHATARNIKVTPGNNSGIPIRGVWQPSVVSGQHGGDIGRELLSQYISGYNTTLTIKPHKGSIPSQPRLGHALEWFEIELPTPRLGNPDKSPSDGDNNDDDGAPHFIKNAIMHLLTSSAVFTLSSPLQRSTLYITHLNATAFHEGEAVGKINYDGSLAVPPGESTTPRLPVQWSLDSLGYQDVKQALGGSLKLAAKANVGVLVGQYHEKLWFSGQGIGAKVRL